jgi:hypothetical protein
MDTVDKLTLELFTNKTNYRKYLSKNDPEKYLVLVEKREKYQKYKRDILDKVENLISFPDIGVSALVQETFENFVDVLIKEIETNALEVKDFEGSGSGSDEDVLFKNIEPSPIQRESELESEKKTFWQSKIDYSYGVKNEGIFDHYPTNTSVRKRFVGRRNSIFP